MKLGDMLSDCARRYPAREAVICGGQRITFAALDEMAHRLANALIGLGQGHGDRVALYLPNGAELVVAVAAIARTGGMIVPISTRLSPAEVRFLLEDCTPSVVMFTPGFRETVAAVTAVADAAPVVVGEPEPGEHGYAALIEAASPRPPPPLPPEVRDLVIGYTSGTTGRPKGAIGTHANIILVHGYMNSIEFGLTGDDITLVTTPMAHRTGLGRIANMFCLGSTVVIMPRFDPAAAVESIERERITVIGGVPTILRLLLPAFERRPEALSSLRTIVATGETFPAALKERLFAILPDLRIFSFLAQTESGFVACLRPGEQRTHPESVGRPVPGVEVRLVDEAMNEVPAGEAGEALVRCGAPGEVMTMRGYYGRPEANAETVLEGGWIRTGDLLRRDEDGYLYFVDRVKDMIVSGGLNIYSKEVELALAEHPAVADAAVIGVPDEDFGEAVMAFVEPGPNGAADPDELIEHCRARIASYKKPKHVRFIEALPRTGAGKVLKGALRALAAGERPA